MIEIIACENDGTHYIEAVQNIINGAATAYQPGGVYVVKIKGWFDHKWLGFSGKRLGAVGVWKHPLTLPPFHPHRVQSQKCYAWRPSTQDYERFDWAARLHIYQESSQNLRREIRRRKPSVLYVWYCSDTARTQRGSLMVYAHTKRDQAAWFISFYSNNQWRSRQAEEISVERIANFEAMGQSIKGELII
ncbi:MAG: hypothetical protein JOZ57_08520 [Abitibacteriaceae bacterium]|nr:hypothetical protein [Abditibacteriaceae bacterium]